jgi:hypothetical protein
MVDFCTRDYTRRTDAGKLLLGEATASYATLDESVIDDMLILNAEMKVILTLRNPVDRAWSHARKDLPEDTRQAKENDTLSTRLQDFLHNDYQIGCSNYRQIIEKWQKKLKDNHLLVVNYHMIDVNPALILSKIWNFLSVDNEWMPNEKLVQSKINARTGSSVPKVINDLLQQTLHDQILWFEQWSAAQEL